jgi:hypothetical protein
MSSFTTCSGHVASNCDAPRCEAWHRGELRDEVTRGVTKRRKGLYRLIIPLCKA